MLWSGVEWSAVAFDGHQAQMNDAFIHSIQSNPSLARNIRCRGMGVWYGGVCPASERKLLIANFSSDRLVRYRRECLFPVHFNPIQSDKTTSDWIGVSRINSIRIHHMYHIIASSTESCQSFDGVEPFTIIESSSLAIVLRLRYTLWISLLALFNCQLLILLFMVFIIIANG